MSHPGYSLPAKPGYSPQELERLGEPQMLERLARLDNPLAFAIAGQFWLLLHPAFARSARRRRLARLQELVEGWRDGTLRGGWPAAVWRPHAMERSRLARSLEILRSQRLARFVMEGPQAAQEELYSRGGALRLLRPFLRLRGIHDLPEFMLEHYYMLLHPGRGLPASGNIVYGILGAIAINLLLIAVQHLLRIAWLEPLLNPVFWAIWIGAILLGSFNSYGRFSMESVLALFISFTDEFPGELSAQEEQ